MPRINQVSFANIGQYDGLAATFGPGNTGLTASDFNGWTIHSFANNPSVPPLPAALGSSANGYLEGTVNARNSIQIDPTGTALPSPYTGNNADYWLRLPVMAVWDQVTAMANGHGTGFCLDLTTSKFALLAIYNQSVAASAPQPQFNAPGWAVSSSGTAPAQDHPLLDGANNGCVHIPWGVWAELAVHVHYGDATHGYIEIFLNRRKICKTVCDTTWDGVSTGINWAAQNWRLYFPNFAGVKWRISGAIETWNGTDITMVPLLGLESGRCVQGFAFPYGAVAAGAGTQGVDFTITTGGSGPGVGTVDAAELGGAGGSGNPSRRRAVSSGTVNGDTVIWTLVNNIGAPKWDANGWWELSLSDWLVQNTPGDSGHQNLGWFYLKNSDGSDFLTLQVAWSNGEPKLFATYGANTWSTAICPWVQSIRYCLTLMLNKDGRMSFSLADVTSVLTTTPGAVAPLKVVQSGPLQNWKNIISGSPNFGAVTINFEYFGGGFMEHGFLAWGPTLSYATLDSYASTLYTPNASSGSTVPLRSFDHMAKALPHGQDCHCIPGGYYAGQEFGLPRRLIVASLAQSGLQRRLWSQVVQSGMQHVHGVELICVDGASFNDLTEAAGNDATVLVEGMTRSVEQLLKLAGENEIRVWWNTMFPKFNNAAVTAVQNDGSGHIQLVTGGGNNYSNVTLTNIYVSGVGSGVDGYYSNATVSGNNITLTGTTWSAGYAAYNSGTITTMSPTQSAAVTKFNTICRNLLRQYQTKGLFALSDIERDYQRGGLVPTRADLLAKYVADGNTLYPNTGGTYGFFADNLHPQDQASTAFYIGAGILAMEMILNRRTVPRRLRTAKERLSS